jgi:hypothetical protein
MNDWDVPRLAAWRRTIGKLPPLKEMVAHYLGYKPIEDAAPVNKESHAENLVTQLLGGM